MARQFQRPQIVSEFSVKGGPGEVGMHSVTKFVSSVAAGSSDSLTLRAGTDEHREVVNMEINMPAVSSATSGTHEARVIDEATGHTVYSTSLSYDSGVEGQRTSSFSNVDYPISDSEGLTLEYANDTDAEQTGDVQITLLTRIYDQ